jgi:hypothetical protein
VWARENPRERRHRRVVLYVQTQKSSSERPLGLQDQEKWLVLLTPAMGKAGEMAGELAKAMGAKAEVPAVLSQGRHLR